MEYWRFFVDESGDDADQSDLFVVGGVLMRTSAQPHRDEPLRLWLASAFPGISYPPHTAHLNYRTGFAVATLLGARQGVRLPPETRAACEAVAEALRGLSMAHESASTFIEALERHEQPGVDVLRSADALLQQRAPRICGGVSALQDRAWRVVGLLFRELQKTVGCEVIAAARDDDDPGANRSDCYRSVLETAVERMFALRRSSSGETQQIWMTAEGRKLPRVGYPPLALSARDLLEIVAAASRFPLDPRSTTDTSVRMDLLDVDIKRPRMHAGLVLADIVMNRLRRLLLGARTMRWAELASYAPRILWNPIEAEARGFPSAGPLPALAVDGSAREAIRATFEGKPTARNAWHAPWVSDEVAAWRRVGGEQ